MIVAIAGGRGFVGRHLVDRSLADGHRVRILTRQPADEGASSADSRVETFVADLRTPSPVLARFLDGVDVAFNCAGVLTDAASMESVHVDGTGRLLEAADRRIRRWVQLSSLGVYGQHRAGTITEDDVPRPSGVYETTKLRSDELVLGSGGSFEVVLLRPAAVFGIGMPNRSLPQLLSAVRRGLFFYVGRPGAIVNYVHVANVVEALTSCATAAVASGRIYNLSDSQPLDALVGAAAAAANRPVPRLRVPEGAARAAVALLERAPHSPLTRSRLDALTSRVRYPTTRIESELGYQHLVSLADGIAELMTGTPVARQKRQT